VDEYWMTVHGLGGLHQRCSGLPHCEVEQAAEIAWAGGLFEGEGTIVLTQRRTHPSKQAHVQVRMADADSLLRYTQALGLPEPKPLQYRRLLHHKQLWYSSVSGRGEAVRVLTLLYPYLGARRRAKAREVLDWAQNEED